MSLPLRSTSPTDEARRDDTRRDEARRDDTRRDEPAAPTATVEWDLVRDTVRWSSSAYPMLARDPGLGPLTLDQLPGQLLPQDRPALCRMVTEALVHGRPLDGVVRVRRPRGAAGAVHCSGRPVLGPDGQVVSLRMLIRAC